MHRGLLAGVVVAGLVIAGGSSAEDPADFTFMGHTIGDPITKHAKDFGKDGCRPANELGIRHCRDRSLREDNSLQYIGSLPVRGLYWTYYNEKLAGFYLYVHRTEFERLTNMLVGKFGNGTPSHGNIVWSTKNGLLILEPVSSNDSRESQLSFLDESASQAIEERMKNASEREGKRVF